VIAGSDRDSVPWWEALARHELVQQRCGACGRWRWPPRERCGRCGSPDWAWETVSGRATVASWIVNHHSFLPGVEAPYTVVLARLEEQDDILVPGAWRGEGEPVMDQPVRAELFERDGDTLIGWRA
jgi:uncharacterized OB-fold protein